MLPRACKHAPYLLPVVVRFAHPTSPSPLTLPTVPEKRFALSGTACCLVSALAYTTTSICMRQLTNLKCDPSWAILCRESVTSAVVAPWLVYQAARGRPALPSGRTLVRLLVVGLVVEGAANVAAQWSLGIVGLAVCVPAQFALMITAGAVLGRVGLGERVTLRSAAAIAILLAALVLLGFGAKEIGGSIVGATAAAPGLLVVALAVVAAGAAGTVYALLSTIIRHSVTRTTAPSGVAFVVPLMAVVSLGPLCVHRFGVAALLATPGEQFAWMAAAGVFNLIGFLAVIHALQRTTVVHANVVNASQVAMAALAGMVLFREPPNPWVLLGVGLTVAGIVWIDRPAEAVDEIPPP
jgi:drug/metabolite transporter, DME family